MTAEPMSITAVLLIAHGSREEVANCEVVEMADRLNQRLEGMMVIPCFLEVVSPTIPEAFQTAVAMNPSQVVAIPFFLGTGAHVRVDIPGILEECQRKHPNLPVRITAAIGPDLGLDEITIRRIYTAQQQMG